MKDKVQRPGRLSYSEGTSGELSAPKLSWDHQLLDLGLFDQIPWVVAKNWSSVWSISNQGTDHCTTVLYNELDECVYVHSWIAVKDLMTSLNLTFLCCDMKPRETVYHKLNCMNSRQKQEIPTWIYNSQFLCLDLCIQDWDIGIGGCLAM
jgi:hypothetical protein